MKLAQILRALLWAAIEDYPGIWEFPDEVLGLGVVQERSAATAIARGGLRLMLEDDLITLFRCREPDGALEPLELGDARSVVEGEWEVGVPGGIGVRVGATTTGEQVYETLTRQALAE